MAILDYLLLGLSAVVVTPLCSAPSSYRQMKCAGEEFAACFADLFFFVVLCGSAFEVQNGAQQTALETFCIHTHTHTPCMGPVGVACTWVLVA